LNPRYSF